MLEENFEYSSPNDIWKNLNITSDIEEKNPKVNKRKNNLTDLMMKFKNNPTNNAKKKIETEINWWKWPISFLSLIK